MVEAEETAADRLSTRPDNKLSLSSLSRSLIPSLFPPPGPFLFVLLRAKPCRSFRRHAFHDGRATPFPLARQRRKTAGGRKRGFSWRPRTRANTDCFMAVDEPGRVGGRWIKIAVARSSRSRTGGTFPRLFRGYRSMEFA